MADEITNTVEPTTSTQEPVQEANTVATEQTQPEADTTANADDQPGAVENGNEAGATTVTETKPQELTEEQVRTKLKEYEVREEEERIMRERLGIKDVDSQTYQYMNLDQQIVNQGKQEYLALCNEYGINADVNKVDASLEQLKQTDPAKAYEFQRRFDALNDNINGRRQVVQHQNTQYEVSRFANDYGQMLKASPAFNNIITEYVQNYGDSTTGMYDQLRSVADIIMPAYKEAFDAGRKYAMEEKTRKDTTGVQGGVATINTNAYSTDGIFTRDQIKRMKPEEFAKYEKIITQQMLEGKIQ